MQGEIEKFLTDVYKENADKIYRYFYSHTYDQALSEDLTSKTFLKAVEKIKSYDKDKSKIITWLFTIARNNLTDYYRLSSTRNSQSMSALFEENEDESLVGSDISINTDKFSENYGNKTLDKSVKSSRNQEMLNIALFEMSEEDQLIIFLRFTQEMSYEEIAKELDLNIGTVGVKIGRCVEKLKKILEKQGNLVRLDIS